MAVNYLKRRLFESAGGNSGSGALNSVVGGTNITIDNTDPANPIINSTADNITVVANYSALPAANTVTGSFFWASASQGTKWLPGALGGTYYSAGMYYSNGTTYEFLDVPYNATQSEVNTGTNNDKFVTPATLTSATQITSKAPLDDPTFTTRINTPVTRATTSGGLLVEASNGTDVGLLGVGNTANATWYGNHNFDAATASTIASFGSSKTLESLSTSTYPSLAELAHVKGLTSALQTQLDAKADLAGVIYQRRRAGRYYHAGIINNPQSYTTGTYAHDFLRAYPVYFPRAVTIDKLATYVNTGVASSNIRIGIYTDNGSFYPDTLIVDSGDISTASGGQKEATVTQSLSPDLYWFAHVFSSSSISFYAMTTSAFNDQFGLDNSATSAQHWRVAHTFGALPSTFTGGGITRNEAMAFLQFVIS